MIPLVVTAQLAGRVLLPSGGGPQFDSLLGAAEARRRGLPPLTSPEQAIPIEVPLQRSDCDRLYLCSVGWYAVEAHVLGYTQRRYPLQQVVEHAHGVKRVQNVGAQKDYRIPRDELRLRSDRVTWWCVGDPDQIRPLLTWVHEIGRKRGVGFGAIRQWKVEACEPWAGFPVLTPEGLPTRPLPLDWPGVASDAERGFATLSDPARGIVSWARDREEELWIPTL